MTINVDSLFIHPRASTTNFSLRYRVSIVQITHQPHITLTSERESKPRSNSWDSKTIADTLTMEVPVSIWIIVN